MNPKESNYENNSNLGNSENIIYTNDTDLNNILYREPNDELTSSELLVEDSSGLEGDCVDVFDSIQSRRR